jgi:XTP/dITP diphosphohydrolase
VTTRLDGGPVLIATRNVGKLAELRPMFARLGVSIRSLDEAGLPETPDEDAIEQFATFEENALAKARHFHHLSGGLPTVADDSGLEVRALGGAPGVRSRRYAEPGAGMSQDEANNTRLLRELTDRADRRARFVCAVALVDRTGELVVRGETAGRIGHDPRGAQGFGYDPLFVSDELGSTFAEASAVQKERVGHRGRAFSALVTTLGSAGGG